MVETRTKRLLEQQDEEPCDNASVDTLAGSEDDDLPRDSAGHVVLYETRQPPKQFMDLVGGAIKFEQLMLCVESYGKCQLYTQMFRDLYTSEAQKEALISKLQRNVYFFQSFIEAKPTYKTCLGERIMFNQYAVEKFRRNNDKFDLIKLL